MDTLFSAILGELTSRSVSFLIDRCSKQPAPPPSKEEKIQRLERMLLRLAVAVEEAEGRRITNHAMLCQVNMLRQDMHRGYYVLDTFRLQKVQEEEDDDDDQVSYSSALSKFNPVKRSRFATGSNRRHGDKGGELEQVLDNLGITIADMVEFVLLLKNYPSMHRQPYNTYMFMDKCMFGRQMEMEHVINFLLLHVEHPNTTRTSVDNLIGVLPIIGPSKVGKSTLVEHVYYDERVRNHFSRIIFLRDKDFREEKSLPTLIRDGGVIRHKHSSSSSASNGERLLVVVELAEDVDDDEWRRMYSSSQSCISAGSKIIITSRSEKIAKLGTTQPLRLKYLSREAYWYFFKVLTFGSSDPEEHPEISSLSMAMFNRYFDQELYNNCIGPFISISNVARFIQATATVYEGRWLSWLRERIRATNKAKKHFLLGRGSGNSELKGKCIFIPWLDETMHYYCEINDHGIVELAHEQGEATPKIDFQDILSGRVALRGKFDLVLWRSHLPPYYSYISSCEIHEHRSPATCRMKVLQKRKI